MASSKAEPIGKYAYVPFVPQFTSPIGPAANKPPHKINPANVARLFRPEPQQPNLLDFMDEHERAVVLRYQEKSIEVGKLLLSGDVRGLREYRIYGEPLSQNNMPLVGLGGYMSPFQAMVVKGQGSLEMVKFILDSNWFDESDFFNYVSHCTVPAHMYLLVDKYLDVHSRVHAISNSSYISVKMSIIYRWARIQDKSDAHSEEECRLVETIMQKLPLSFGMLDIYTYGDVFDWLRNWCPRCRDLVLAPNKCIRPSSMADLNAARNIITHKAINKADMMILLRCYLEAIRNSTLKVSSSDFCTILLCYDEYTADLFWEFQSDFDCAEFKDVVKTMMQMKCGNQIYGEILRLVTNNSRRGEIPEPTRVGYKELVSCLGTKLGSAIAIECPGLVNITQAPMEAIIKTPELFLQTNPSQMNKGAITKFFIITKDMPGSDVYARHMLSFGPLTLLNNESLCRFIMNPRYRSSSRRHMVGINMMRKCARHYYADPLMLGMYASPHSPLKFMDTNALQLILHNLLVF